MRTTRSRSSSLPTCAPCTMRPALRKQRLARRGVIADSAVRDPAAGVPVELLALVDEHLAHVPP